MKSKKMLLVSITAMFFTLQGHAAIKKCTANETSEISSARNFLRSNLDTILGNVSGLTGQDKRKIKRKVKNINIKCLDHRRVCKKRDNVVGVERNIFKTSIVLCYERIRNMGNSAFCGLADTILHEIGHSAGVSKASNHNDGPNGDRVYRLGDAAENLCNTNGLNRAIL